MKTDSIEEIEHTADLSIKVSARELHSLFVQAAVGMTKLVGGMDTNSAIITRVITLQSADIETLLVCWLEEILFILETEDLLLVNAQVQLPSKTQLLSTVGLLPAIERWKEIKAVTYNDLQILETSAGFEVTIVFDV